MADAFKIKQGDTSRPIRHQLFDSAGNEVDLTGATVAFHMSRLGQTPKVNAAAVVVDAATGIVEYRWQAGDTDTPGVFVTEWEVTYADWSIDTFPADGHDQLKISEELA